MPYEDLYFARRIADIAGLGRRFWMLKLPRRAEIPSESILLGSLVEQIDRPLGVSYPLPFSLTTPQILLKRMSEERHRINLPTGDPFVISQTVVNAVITATAGTNLDVGVEASFPGIPISVGVGISNSNLAEVSIVLNEGAEIQYIPTDYINRFAKLYNGKDSEAFPQVAIDVADHLFVDIAILAKNYSVEYAYQENLSERAEAKIQVLNAQLGPRLECKKSSSYSISVTVKDNYPYLLGFKTIDWDDLDC